MKKKRAKRLDKVAAKMTAQGFNKVMAQIAAVEAQITGVKCDVETLQNKVLAVCAVMTAQSQSAFALYKQMLDVAVRKRSRR